MIILACKDNFTCAVLESNELGVFCTAKKLAYQDAEQAKDPNATAILNALETVGTPYFEEVFKHDKALVIQDEDGQIIGSGQIDYNLETQTSSFDALHIRQSHRGQGLADLLYEANAAFLKDHTDCKTMTLFINDPQNWASIIPALRNGFTQTIRKESGRMIFERAL